KSVLSALRKRYQIKQTVVIVIKKLSRDRYRAPGITFRFGRGLEMEVSLPIAEGEQVRGVPGAEIEVDVSVFVYIARCCGVVIAVQIQSNFGCHIAKGTVALV